MLGHEETLADFARYVPAEARQKLDLLRMWEELEPDRCQSIRPDWYQLRLSGSGSEAVWQEVGYGQAPQVARAIAQAAVQDAAMSRKWGYRVETIFEAGSSSKVVRTARAAAHVYACDEEATVLGRWHEVSHSPAEALLRAYLRALKHAPIGARHQRT